MKNQNVKQSGKAVVKECAEGVVREEIRKGNLIKSNNDILSMLPELIDTVHMDKERMRKSINKCLTSKNPFNVLLNLFGVQLIKKEKITSLLSDGMDYSDVTVEIDESYAKHLLTLNKTDFETIVEKISQKLYELETQANQSYNDEKSRGDKLFDKYEKLTKEYNELKYNTEVSEQLIAERIQYILSTTDSDKEQLIELLKDMGVDVYWDSSDAPLADAAMFTEYVVDDESVDDESMVSTKPCLIKDDSVYIKGIRFIRK